MGRLKSGIDAFPLALPAPAKINLALHVVGRRDSGHHLLESIVTFADAGDRIGIAAAEADGFSLSGAFAGDVPQNDDAGTGNLVLKARQLLRDCLSTTGQAAPPVHLHLEKNLPVASGIGGGSADAAATLKGLIRHWNARIGAADLAKIALQLGADVPMCLQSRPLLACGIGEEITPLADLPALPLLLVNPRVGVSTPVIFRMLVNKTNPPLSLPSAARSVEDWVLALSSMRNDLEPPARALEPLIEDVSAALAKSGARLSRMSGSGATCFAVFDSADHRDRAAAILRKQRPDWYILACTSLCGAHHPDIGDPS